MLKELEHKVKEEYQEKLNSSSMETLMDVISQMGGVQVEKDDQSTFLVKDTCKFAKIHDGRLYFLNRYASLYEFDLLMLSNQDKVLFAATSSYWVASGKHKAQQKNK